MTLWWLMARQPWVSIARQLNGKALLAVGTIPGHHGVLRPGQPLHKRRPIVLDTSLLAARVISCNTCLAMQRSIMTLLANSSGSHKSSPRNRYKQPTAVLGKVEPSDRLKK